MLFYHLCVSISTFRSFIHLLHEEFALFLMSCVASFNLAYMKNKSESTAEDQEL